MIFEAIGETIKLYRIINKLDNHRKETSYSISIFSTNETNSFFVFIHLIFFLPQFRKGVDNNTEDNVQKDDIDKRKEAQIVEISYRIICGIRL